MELEAMAQVWTIADTKARLSEILRLASTRQTRKSESKRVALPLD
jgi:hypothetical protein